MKFVELAYAKGMQWLGLNFKVNASCKLCRSGRRVERRGFLHFVHPTTDGPDVWCYEPSWWILMERRKKSSESKVNSK